MAATPGMADNDRTLAADSLDHARVSATTSSTVRPGWTRLLPNRILDHLGDGRSASMGHDRPGMIKFRVATKNEM
jgi:hypothetical protein